MIILFLVIYIAFIGLGIPDSLFGTAWPAIYAEFELPLSYGSFISAIVYGGTMLSAIFSARLIKKFGTYGITVFSTALTAVGLLGFSFSGNFIFLCVCAIPLGLGAGAIDTALSNYIALNFSSKQMNFMHCFYGIGISLSPFILSLVISGEGGWRHGYLIAFMIQAAIALILLISFPAWKKVKNQKEEKKPVLVMKMKEIMKTPGVIPTWAIIIGVVSIECIINIWGGTYLVESKSLTRDIAAQTILFYFIGLACGLFVAGLVASKLHSWKIIIAGQSILGVALVLLFLPGNRYLLTVALFLIGFGNGPLFPNVNYLTPENFGADKTPSIMGTNMAVGSLSLLLSPVLCGALGQAVGMWILPILLLVLYAVIIVNSILLKHIVKPQKTAE